MMLGNKNIVVTGASGFIGSALVPFLIEKGYEVTIFSSSEVNVADNLLEKIEWNTVDHIIHLAAKTFVPDSWENPSEFYNVNLQGTVNILEVCRKYNISLTYMSAYIYGTPLKNPIKETDIIKPNNPYSQSKYFAEEACKFYSLNFNVNVVILRPFNIYGKGQRTDFLIPSVLQQVLFEDKINVKSLLPKRDYVYIDDLLEVVKRTMEHAFRYNVFNVGSGISYSVKEVIEIMQKIAGTNKPVESMDSFRINELDDTIADIEKIKKELGWKPQYTLEEGLKIMIKEKNIPINKGNYTLETPEREENFELCRSEGWEKEYKEYRENWVKCAKTQKVLDYPLLVDIELSSLCNLKCPMCYTITEEFKHKVNAKLMEENLFKKIIDEIALKVPAIRLSLRGEPTLHPQLIEFAKYAKQKGVREISFLTNGSRFTKEYFEQILESGVDWITISIDGVGDMYEGIRRPLKFCDIFEIVKMIKAVKTEKKVHRPVIKIQSIWPAIKENPEEFYNLFSPYADAIAFNPLIDYLDNDNDIVYTENFSCPQLYQRLVVGADGSVMMCSNDEENANIIGNANIESIYGIWHGEKLKVVRGHHKVENGYKEISVCKRCYLPRKTVVDEYAIVNGRKVEVENYVNRAQEIGK